MESEQLSVLTWPSVIYTDITPLTCLINSVLFSKLAEEVYEET